MQILDQAQNALTQKEYQKAKRLFEQALQKKENKGLALQGLAESFYFLGKYDAAARYANESLSENSQLTRSRLVLSYVYARKQDVEQSFTEIQKAFTTEPDMDDATALGFLGGLLLAKGKTTEALNVLHRAIKVDGENWIAHYNLGIYKLSKKSYKNAISELGLSFYEKPSIKTIFYLLNCYLRQYSLFIILAFLFLLFISLWFGFIEWMLSIILGLETVILSLAYILEHKKRYSFWALVALTLCVYCVWTALKGIPFLEMRWGQTSF